MKIIRKKLSDLNGFMFFILAPETPIQKFCKGGAIKSPIKENLISSDHSFLGVLLLLTKIVSNSLHTAQLSCFQVEPFRPYSSN
jgi:hypothetical protein